MCEPGKRTSRGQTGKQRADSDFRALGRNVGISREGEVLFMFLLAVIKHPDRSKGSPWPTVHRVHDGEVQVAGA